MTGSQPAEHGTSAARGSRRRLISLSLLALGIVYGDIGTSPLYALRECFHGAHAIAVTPANIHGVLSLIFWTLVVVVTVKYHVYVLRFDNRGEGGILALLSLIGVSKLRQGALRSALVVLGVFGAALLYGDGMITPAISVLSAVEGIEVALPAIRSAVVPITLAILVLLFAFQRRGTAGIGIIFGPVTLLWFLTLGVLGIRGILMEPSILAAMNPMYAFGFFATNGLGSFLILGAVFLVATGGEALYADLGHFGEKPIQLDWFLIVAPALLLHYFGQGALLVHQPEAAVNPFYLLAPAWARIPLVVLATSATIIASQAVISGAFSLTRQAIQLGYLPRMEIVHTSSSDIGQIYIPAVNRALMLATLALVLGFRSSTNIAAAYGVAVSTTMIVTTVLAYFVAVRVKGWSRVAALAVTFLFLVPDTAFLIANYFKIGAGGWVPLLVALLIFATMTTWRQGRERLTLTLRETAVPAESFIRSIRHSKPHRVRGTAVFLHRDDRGIPNSLLHSLKHYKTLHETVIILTLSTEEVPHVDDDARIDIQDLGEGVFRLRARFGYREEPAVPLVLELAARAGLPHSEMETTYFLGRESLVLRKDRGSRRWRDAAFAWMLRNAEGAARFFRLPPNRVVELGAQIEM